MSRPTRHSRKSISPSPQKPTFTSPKKNIRSTDRSSRVLRALDTDLLSVKSQKTTVHSLELKQRNVFDWYERYQYQDDKHTFSPDAGDIFSSEWQFRIKEWDTHYRKAFGRDTKSLYDRVDSYENHSEDLEFGLFFLAHPISAFSLWHVLQACYELDKLICGSSVQEKTDITAWQTWQPFKYLLSTEIVSKWEMHLNLFSAEIQQSTNRFEKEAIASRLHTIFRHVQFLEETLSTLVIAFQGKQTSMPCPGWMLDLVRNGVNDRCRAIEEHITYQKSTQ